MDKLGLAQEDYWWYLDLRRYGSVPHSGYGLGFNACVCYATGRRNIRYAIAFPAYPGNAVLGRSSAEISPARGLLRPRGGWPIRRPVPVPLS